MRALAQLADECPDRVDREIEGARAGRPGVHLRAKIKEEKVLLFVRALRLTDEELAPARAGDARDGAKRIAGAIFPKLVELDARTALSRRRGAVSWDWRG